LVVGLWYISQGPSIGNQITALRKEARKREKGSGRFSPLGTGGNEKGWVGEARSKRGGKTDPLGGKGKRGKTREMHVQFSRRGQRPKRPWG